MLLNQVEICLRLWLTSLFFLFFFFFVLSYSSAMHTCHCNQSEEQAINLANFSLCLLFYLPSLAACTEVLWIFVPHSCLLAVKVRPACVDRKSHRQKLMQCWMYNKKRAILSVYLRVLWMCVSVQDWIYTPKRVWEESNEWELKQRVREDILNKTANLSLT